jgi:hypothetical protein
MPVVQTRVSAQRYSLLSVAVASRLEPALHFPSSASRVNCAVTGQNGCRSPYLARHRKDVSGGPLTAFLIELVNCRGSPYHYMAESPRGLAQD